MRELESEVAEKEINWEDQTRKTVDDLIKKKERMAKTEKLRKPRLDRVIEEIDLADIDGEIVFAQHRKLGQIHRLFQLKDKMLAVYDWFGSLSCEPMYFELTQPFSRVPVSPDAPVEKFNRTILQMIVVNETIVMSENKRITFSRYHQDLKEIFEKVEEKREDSLNILQPYFQIIEVDRNNVLKNMLEIYNTPNDLKNFHLLVKFKGENAEGDGVPREAYSLFIEQLIFTSCAGRMHFVPIIQPEFGEEEFNLFHFYINYSLFPVQFC